MSLYDSVFNFLLLYHEDLVFTLKTVLLFYFSLMLLF